MLYVYKEFLFPFGIEEKTLKRLHGFLSRWTVTGKYAGGYLCYDKYYRKRCFFRKSNGTSVMVYDWRNQYDEYDMSRLSRVFFNSKIIKLSPLVEIFPNRWDDMRIRVLYDGDTPAELYFTANGEMLVPGDCCGDDGMTGLDLGNGFKVYRTFDKKKPFRIVHENGQYFVVKNGYVESHIPFLRRAELSSIYSLLV